MGPKGLQSQYLGPGAHVVYGPQYSDKTAYINDINFGSRTTVFALVTVARDRDNDNKDFLQRAAMLALQALY